MLLAQPALSVSTASSKPHGRTAIMLVGGQKDMNVLGSQGIDMEELAKVLKPEVLAAMKEALAIPVPPVPPGKDEDEETSV